ncbi:putative rhamnogalacturonate lyase C [Penicillium rolfsii]|nr:putative rhamnogalacturonate lyase C [Penicillium rolfsii]
MSGLHEMIHRQRSGLWQRFWTQPCVFLAQRLYSWHTPILAMPLINPIAVVCISDTHNVQISVPDGDILIHAGDLTQSGSFQELQDALGWLRSLPHPIKIVIAGNHELLLDSAWDDSSGQAASKRAQLDWGDIIYLKNDEVTIPCSNGRQLRVYGSPYSIRHGNWAFQYPQNQDIWTGSVPDGIDVLITHSPPFAHLDLLKLGCPHLLQTLWRVRPRLHVFGHVHEGSGTDFMLFNGLQEAYERTIAAGGGFNNLLLTAWELAKTCLRPAVEANCLLVNPSIVGGLRDNERKQPIKVFI